MNFTEANNYYRLYHSRQTTKTSESAPLVRLEMQTSALAGYCTPEGTAQPDLNSRHTKSQRLRWVVWVGLRLSV